MREETGGIEFVILAAGKATRNYPHSKGLPHKALLPIGSVKVIDKVMKEPIEAGIKNVTIVVSNEAAKQAFEACFTREKHIEDKFEKSGNTDCLQLLQSLYVPEDVKIRYVIQSEPKGSGHAVGLVAAARPGKSLVVRLPDDILISRHVRRDQKKGEKTFCARVLEHYLKKGGRGNLFVTQTTSQPSRWGIVKDGQFFEKPKGMSSGEASFAMIIFDKDYAALLAEKAKLADKKGTPEYKECEAGKEFHYCDYINDFVRERPEQALRSYTIPQTEILLDGGTIQGYEEAVIYSLLHESRFARHNRKVAKAQFGVRKWISKLGQRRRK
jgi:UTP-glucose-1-phosphate uridylyltransferase